MSLGRLDTRSFQQLLDQSVVCNHYTYEYDKCGIVSIRVQVVLNEHERDLFRRQAKADGLSLSAWLKRAGHDRLSAADGKGELKSVEDLRTFFKRCDEREQGREPEWEQHLEVIDRSRTTGLSGT